MKYHCWFVSKPTYRDADYRKYRDIFCSYLAPLTSFCLLFFNLAVKKLNFGLQREKRSHRLSFQHCEHKRLPECRCMLWSIGVQFVLEEADEYRVLIVYVCVCERVDKEARWSFCFLRPRLIKAITRFTGLARCGFAGRGQKERYFILWKGLS